MKTIFKLIITALVIVGVTVPIRAQETEDVPKQQDSTLQARLPAYGTITPYELRITYGKTTHLIFPSAIRYVDLGSENLTAGKAEDAENVLRIKAAVKNFSEETNFSVITEDGKFYSFTATYSDYPLEVTLNFGQATARSQREEDSGMVLFKELGAEHANVPLLVMQTIFRQNKKTIRHIGAESFGVQVLLTGIYTLDGKLYFLLEYRNQTYIPFTIDFITFKVVDKKIAKRTVIQERVIQPLREYLSLKSIPGQSRERNVYLLEQMTIPDDKLLKIEIYEKNGGRHQVLEVDNADLIKARPVKNMHLYFK